MKIPAHLQDTVARLSLRSWVTRKDFPRDFWFETIEQAKTLLRRHPPHDPDDEAPPDEPDTEAIAVILATALDAENRLVTYVTDTATTEIKNEDDWHRICMATAWLILQAYETAVRKQEWVWPHSAAGS